MNQRLAGKTAVVTGGSRGFGRAMVDALAREGARVIAVARRPFTIEGVEAIAGDATDAFLCARIIEKHHPDLVVLNAGAQALIRPLRQHTWETFSVNYQSDLKSAFVWSREATMLPLAKGSTIVLVSSGAAFSSAPLIEGYASAKAALLRFGVGLAEEARPLGIRVRVVCPALSPFTELGREAVEGFVRAGMSKGPDASPLTADGVGRAIVELALGAEEAIVHHLDGNGLRPDQSK